MKKASGDVIILNMCNKNTIIWCTLTQVWSVTDIIFCHFRPFFPLLPHYWPRKLKFGKNVKKKKNTCRYYPFTHVYHWSRSYDVWFLRYEVQQTGIFVFLGNFLSFYQPPPLPNSLKKENIKNEKKPWRYHHFTQVQQKSQSSAILFQRYGTWQMFTITIVIFHFGLSFALLPP